MTRSINTGNALGAKVLWADAFQEGNFTSRVDDKGGLSITTSGAAITATSPGPAAQMTGADGTIIVSAGTPVTAAPFTMAVMAYLTSNPGDQSLMCVTIDDTHFWELFTQANFTGITARTRAGGVASDAVISGGVSSNTWINAAAVYGAANDRKVYKNGTLSASDTTSVTPTGSLRYVGVGALQRNGSAQSTAVGAYFKYAVIFNGALTQSELDSFFANPEQIYNTAGPNITVHPSNQTVTAPATANFSVTASATGGGSLSYQWQRSTNGGSTWSNVSTGSGGTTNSYTTAATSVSGGNANNGDQWRCVVTETGGSNAGSVNSNAATLTVNASSSGPTINTQPSNQTVTTPATATFTVSATASGGSLSYQWQRSTNGGSSWANVTTGTGGTTNSYTTAATSVSGGNANNGDLYRCAVTDSNGTTNSNSATLTVNATAGRITTPPIKNNTGTILALTSGWTVYVKNATTDEPIVTKTGLSTDSSGVITFTDAAIVTGTNYAYDCVHATYGRRCPTATAT